MSKIIPALTGKELIGKAFSNQSVRYWHISDKVLRLPTLTQVVNILNNFTVLKYAIEIGDCDNRALLLAAKFVEKGLAIAMIDVEQLDLGENHPDYRHQMCAVILDKDPPTVLVIEPSTGHMFEPNELLRLTFVDLRT